MLASLWKTVVTAANTVWQLVKLVTGFRNEKTPFFVEISFDGVLRMPSVLITNRTKDIPLYVSSVNVICGFPLHYIGICFWPREFVALGPDKQNAFFGTGGQIPPASIPPKGKYEFTIDLWHSYTGVVQGVASKDKAALNAELPKVDGFQVAHAITMCPSEQTWIDIDFNEQKGRAFLRGKVKWAFERMIEVSTPEEKALISPLQPIG